MTKYEAAVVGLYTGVLIGEFADMHEYMEQLMERPIFSHQLANAEFVKEMKNKAKPAFLEICNSVGGSN